MYRILLVASLLVFASCGRRRPVPSAVPELPAQQLRIFMPVIAPDSLDAAARRSFMRDHYWDRLDFGDSLFFAEADSTQMLEAYAAYVGWFLDPNDPQPMYRLMERACVSKTSLQYFAWLAGEVLDDPNSPLRNAELYIPVLEAQASSPLLDRWEKIAPEHDLRLARQNRIGHPANDIRYTLASGNTSNLYSLHSDYVLLFINNPGCPMCRELSEAVAQSPMLSELIERGSLTVLAIYPDEDLSQWRSHRDEIPSSWINAYDRGTRMSIDGTYDLRAIPSLYLLDAEKRVLARDVTDVAQIEWVLDHHR